MLAVVLKFKKMKYKDFLIDQDKTGYASKEEMFSFFLDDGEKYCGSGYSIEYCKIQIDEYYE